MYKQAWKFELQRCLAGLLHIAAGVAICSYSGSSIKECDDQVTKEVNISL